MTISYLQCVCPGMDAPQKTEMGRERYAVNERHCVAVVLVDRTLNPCTVASARGITLESHAPVSAAATTPSPRTWTRCLSATAGSSRTIFIYLFEIWSHSVVLKLFTLNFL